MSLRVLHVITSLDRGGAEKQLSLLAAGLVLIASCMLLLSWGFGSATYTLGAEAAAGLPQGIDQFGRVELGHGGSEGADAG